jgi:MoxR-like ATPase
MIAFLLFADEFNRIEAEVLSVVSSQIKQIQEALKHGVRRFIFEGREIGIDNRTGIFITMNPGYAGRTELPGALRRPHITGQLSRALPALCLRASNSQPRPEG